MIHYHGGPITPDTCAIKAWKSRHAFISFAHASQINLASEYCQTFALDTLAQIKALQRWPTAPDINED